VTSIRDNAYVYARTAVMSARLVREEDLMRLVLAPVGDDSELAILRVLGLEAALPEDREDVAALEHALLQVLLADFRILVRPMTGVRRQLLLHWVRGFELGNLKAMIRGKQAGLSPATIARQLVDMGGFTTLPVDELLATEDVAELLRRLEVTPYAPIARRARAVFEERNDPFALDAAVDRRYYVGLDRWARQLGDEENAPLRPLLGGIIDRLNLLWLLRYRFAYGLSAAQTYYLLIPAGYRMKNDLLRGLVRLESGQEVLEALPEPYRGLLQGLESTAEVERVLELELQRIAAKVLRGTRFHMARAVAYLVLREIQLRRVLALLKGKALNLAEDLCLFASGLTGGRLLPEAAEG